MTAPVLAEVFVNGRCPAKGCVNRRRNTLATDGARWGVPTEYGEFNPRQFRLPRLTPVSVAVASCFYLQHQSEPSDPRESPHRFTAGIIHSRVRFLAFTESMYSLGWVCEEHDLFMTIGAVIGVVNFAKTCDARCWNATGEHCECSCGGRSHGAAWAPTPGDDQS